MAPSSAAFPFCTPTILVRGDDCLPLMRTREAHPEPHANDVLTWLRLSRMLRRGDRPVSGLRGAAHPPWHAP